jgi:RNA polymerase sigma-70 factor (ECF subfamily)
MNDELQSELISQLMASHQQRLTGYIRSLVPDRADAEDVLQEVNLFIWRHGDEFEPGSNFAAWVFRIARYHVLDFRKRRVAKIRFSDAVVQQLAESAAEGTNFGSSRLHALEQCLQKLPEKDQTLVRLRYEPDATTLSVAERSGRSLKGVYNSLNRIRTVLLECIQRTLAKEARR